LCIYCVNLGTTGDAPVGAMDLSFPEGVNTCTFAVLVTSNIVGSYLNDTNNFTDTFNIDTSQNSATLAVIEDPSDANIEVLKDVFPPEVSIGEEVTITIINLGTKDRDSANNEDTATAIIDNGLCKRLSTE
tara:strand:- start:20565 stop:20957 length:393 start_codon:yes stop_codon:yes gene_type:complete